LVAGLEDVEREGRAGKQYDRERKNRQAGGHVMNLARGETERTKRTETTERDFRYEPRDGDCSEVRGGR
jgi:hypothetical protein